VPLKRNEAKYMKSKTQTICTAALLLGAVTVMAINFSAGWNGGPPQAVNIAATVFYLIFWVLMLRFKPAAKTSALLSLYTMIGCIIGFCSVAGNWGGGIITVLIVPVIFPPASLFYGLRIVGGYQMFYILSAVISFVIMIFSLITLVNKPSKTE